MQLSTTLYGVPYDFHSVREVMAKANEQKSGDTLAGIGARDAKERIILDDLDKAEYAKIRNTTIGDLREQILDNRLSGAEILKMGRGMSSEVIAALAKLMGNLDLMYVSKKLQVTAHCNTTIGEAGTFAVRLQPNHPTDDVKGVTASLLEGLSYGAGDAVLGLNPAVDTVKSTTDILNLFHDVKTRLKIPTQTCVLSHITTQMAAVYGVFMPRAYWIIVWTAAFGSIWE